MTIAYPDPFLEVRVDHLHLPLPMAALCAGYEGKAWRAARLADHLFQWLPYVALNQESQLDFTAANFVEMLRVAAAHIYNTKRTASRGELGELLLHLTSVLHFGCVPVMCKLVLKSSSNDTVKGFDGVHLVANLDGFDLWLGESKFYTDPHAAIRDAVASIKQHILPAFLTCEKAMIFGHIAPDTPHHDAVVKLFKSQTSSDALLAQSVFPVLIAYESGAVSSYAKLCQEYTDLLETEVSKLRQYFSDKATGVPLRFQLIMIPMESKQDVVTSFDSKLLPFLA